jgi:hypothetical protein
MFIKVGVYRFHPKRIAFRNDYCLSCRQARRSVQIRSFDVMHIFWIPLLPLGFWKHWICTACGRRPDVNVKTRRSFKWAGLFILLLLAVTFWVGPIPPDFTAGSWAIRIAAPLGAILLLVHLLRSSKDPSRKERLAAIPSATDTVCPFCGSNLLCLASQCSCPACGVLRC